jgi:hypothetical protein
MLFGPRKLGVGYYLFKRDVEGCCNPGQMISMTLELLEIGVTNAARQCNSSGRQLTCSSNGVKST